MANNHVAAITMDIKRLFDMATANSESCSLAIIILNVNELLLRADFFAIPQTWMDTVTLVNINNFQLVHQLLYESRVGGVAV